MRGGLLGLASAMIWFAAGMPSASAQAYHQLTLADFRGIPRAVSEDVIAHTHCTITFHYEAHPQNGYYLINFDIRTIMDRERSWVAIARVNTKDMLAEILKHEQGHYAISYMEQQELLRIVGRTVFSANYRSEAQSIFDRVDARYKQLNLDYDADTQHMLNHAQQSSWNAYFDKNIAYMPPLVSN